MKGISGRGTLCSQVNSQSSGAPEEEQRENLAVQAAERHRAPRQLPTPQQPWSVHLSHFFPSWHHSPCDSLYYAGGCTEARRPGSTAIPPTAFEAITQDMPAGAFSQGTLALQAVLPLPVRHPAGGQVIT